MLFAMFSPEATPAGPARGEIGRVTGQNQVSPSATPCLRICFSKVTAYGINPIE
jgi:hypothetical protein